MDHGVKVATVLADSYATHASIEEQNQDRISRTVQLGFSLGRHRKLGYRMNFNP